MSKLISDNNILKMVTGMKIEKEGENEEFFAQNPRKFHGKKEEKTN